MAPVGLELANPARQQPRIYALDCGATGIGVV